MYVDSSMRVWLPVAFVLAVIAWGDSRPDAHAAVTCSAARLPAVSDQAGLPRKVAATRRAIADAARACDFGRLNRLARGGKGFTHSYGAAGTPGQHWRRLERAGEPVLRILVRILDLPHVRNEAGQYAWPSAYREHPTARDWKLLEGIYTRKQIAGFKRYGSYLGYRVGITKTGRWLFFVSGD
jgi:hypothetical protein